jgi:hypothetical protein
MPVKLLKAGSAKLLWVIAAFKKRLAFDYAQNVIKLAKEKKVKKELTENTQSYLCMHTYPH